MTVDGFDFARLFQRGGVVGVKHTLESKDGDGDGVPIAVAGSDLRDDVLVAEEAGDGLVVVLEVAVEVVKDFVEGGRLGRLGMEWKSELQEGEQEGESE